MQKANHVSVTN